jgi:hypothetical protein
MFLPVYSSNNLGAVTAATFPPLPQSRRLTSLSYWLASLCVIILFLFIHGSLILWSGMVIELIHYHEANNEFPGYRHSFCPSPLMGEGSRVRVKNWFNIN